MGIDAGSVRSKTIRLVWVKYARVIDDIRFDPERLAARRRARGRRPPFLGRDPHHAHLAPAERRVAGLAAGDASPRSPRRARSEAQLGADTSSASVDEHAKWSRRERSAASAPSLGYFWGPHLRHEPPLVAFQSLCGELRPRSRRVCPRHRNARGVGVELRPLQPLERGPSELSGAFQSPSPVLAMAGPFGAADGEGPCGVLDLTLSELAPVPSVSPEWIRAHKRAAAIATERSHSHRFSESSAPLQSRRGRHGGVRVALGSIPCKGPRHP